LRKAGGEPEAGREETFVTWSYTVSSVADMARQLDSTPMFSSGNLAIALRRLGSNGACVDATSSGSVRNVVQNPCAPT